MNLLAVVVPAHNESEVLPVTLPKVPTNVEGFDSVEIIVVDDGSTDGTADVAQAHGAHHVLRSDRNRGLGQSFGAGVAYAVEIGANVVVVLDADDQYPAEGIPGLVGPICTGDADVVIGDRRVWSHPDFPMPKRMLQSLGSWVVRRLSGTNVPDAASGFRAYSREAASTLIVHSHFSYTLETLIQLGRERFRILSIPIAVNPARRPSRLASGSLTFIRRQAGPLFGMFAVYRPLWVFVPLAAMLAVGALVSWMPFALEYVRGDGQGHVQSLIFGAVLVVAAFIMLALGVIGHLLAVQRDLINRSFRSLGVRSDDRPYTPLASGAHVDPLPAGQDASPARASTADP